MRIVWLARKISGCGLAEMLREYKYEEKNMNLGNVEEEIPERAL